jgi:hypothetical protein
MAIKIRKKPWSGEALRYTGDNAEEIEEWSQGKARITTLSSSRRLAYPSGWVIIYGGNWIVQGDANNYRVVSDRQFHNLYEEVKNA